MPFQSEAQRRKFQNMLNEKKITKKVFDEWSNKTPDNIPDRKHPKKATGIEALKNKK